MSDDSVARERYRLHRYLAQATDQQVRDILGFFSRGELRVQFAKVVEIAHAELQHRKMLKQRRE